jgi:hypothetical protein
MKNKVLIKINTLEMNMKKIRSSNSNSIFKSKAKNKKDTLKQKDFKYLSI